MTNTPLTDVDTALDEILEDTAEVLHDEWCVDEECRLSRSNLVNEHMGEEKKQLKQLIGTIAEQIREEDYLLECFEAVAQYADNPRELGGMKPETALLNYKNRLKQLTTTPAPEGGSENNEADGQRLKDYMENKQ